MIGCTWIVSERGDRWRRAVHGFAPTILPGGFERLSTGPSEVPEAVRRHRSLPTARIGVKSRTGVSAFSGAAEAGKGSPTAARAVVVLYELPLENPRETLVAVARCAALEHPPLQLVAFAPELHVEGRAELELTAAVRQLGADAVLRHPEHLWQMGRFIARYVDRWEQLASRRL